jgi:ubiquinone/menaquinone biosynthesis C-methylase UbiE
MNVFLNPSVANQYEDYYTTEAGQKIDAIEKKLITELLNDIPSSSMLELGSGTGHWTEFFIEKGFQPTAVDISEPMLEVAKNKGLEAEFLKADARKLPFGDHSFSVVAAITMLEFIDDRKKVFQEINRVLKPGGWLLLGCLNAHSEIGRNKEKDEVFRSAYFYTLDELFVQLSVFGKPLMKYGVYFSPTFEILDGKTETSTVEPAFIAARVKKTR